MSAGEESLELQGLTEWVDPQDSFALRSGQMTYEELISFRNELESRD